MSSFTQCIARTAIGLAALSAACSVQAFADDDARRAILELRESIKTLQTDLEANRNAQIQLSTEINNLKELNRRLTGRIEELVNAQNQEKRNARTQYETLDKRLAVFEPQVVVIDGQSIEVSAEEKKAYDMLVFFVFFIILTAFGMKAPFSSRNSCIQRSKAAHIRFSFR